VYLIALAVFLLLMSILTYIARSWLGSITDPRNVISNYEYYAKINGNFLWISALILLILANVILWKTRKTWAFWTTLLYFVFFVVLHTFWLDKSFLEYKRGNSLQLTGFSLTPFIGAVFCVLAAVLIFFNQLLVLKMRDKMFPPALPVEDLPGDLPEESPEEEKKEESE
jgi:hypothetical protein